MTSPTPAIAVGRHRGGAGLVHLVPPSQPLGLARSLCGLIPQRGWSFTAQPDQKRCPRCQKRCPRCQPETPDLAIRRDADRVDNVSRPAPREHSWGWAGRAPYGDLYRCARPGCKADPEDDPDTDCTGYDPDTD